MVALATPRPKPTRVSRTLPAAARKAARESVISSIADYIGTAGPTEAGAQVARAGVAAELRRLGIDEHLAAVLARADAERPLPSVSGLGRNSRAAHAAGPYYRAAYLVRAAQRVQAATADPDRSGAAQLATEQGRFLTAHQTAQLARERGALRLDAAADTWGSVLGWYAWDDDRTTPECAAANGKNFDPADPPGIGLPGIGPHVGCRCYAGPAHEGAAMMAGHATVHPVAPPAEIAASVDSMEKASTPSPLGSPGGPGLWHHKGKQLPPYIQHIAKALIRGGMGESQAIATAVNTVKRWAAGGGKVHPDTQAAAQKALGEWEADKADTKLAVVPGSVPVRSVGDGPRTTGASTGRAAFLAAHAKRRKRRQTVGLSIWSELKHPRLLKGHHGGGEFTRAGLGSAILDHKARRKAKADALFKDRFNEKLPEGPDNRPDRVGTHVGRPKLPAGKADPKGAADFKKRWNEKLPAGHDYHPGPKPTPKTKAQTTRRPETPDPHRLSSADMSREAFATKFWEQLDAELPRKGETVGAVATKNGSWWAKSAATLALAASLSGAAGGAAGDSLGFTEVPDFYGGHSVSSMKGHNDEGPGGPNLIPTSIGRSLSAAQREVLELAGHHVAGEAYRFRHGWKPVDAVDMKTWIVDQIKKDHATSSKNTTRDLLARFGTQHPTALRFKPDTATQGRGALGRLDQKKHPTAMTDKIHFLPNTFLPDQRESVRTAVAAVNKVHHDGDMRPATLLPNPYMLSGIAGEFRDDSPADGPVIDISTKDSPHPALTAVHEIGHYIDRRGFGESSSSMASEDAHASRDDTPMRRFVNEATLSHTTQQNLVEGDRDKTQAPYVAYLTSPREQWGRAYAQYVATKTANPELIHDLAVARSMDEGYPIQQYWGDDEFAPIGRAVEATLAEAGWLNK